MSNVPSFNQAIVDSREQLESGRERLKQQHQSGSPGIQVCTGISDLFDDIVLNLVNLAFDQVTSSESERQQLEQVIAVVAHGGAGPPLLRRLDRRLGAGHCQLTAGCLVKAIQLHHLHLRNREGKPGAPARPNPAAAR